MVKLTRNKMIAELVLTEHTIQDVADAFDLSGPRIRRITQEIIGKANNYSQFASTDKILVSYARGFADKLVPKIRALTDSAFELRKTAGKMKTHKHKRTIV